MKKEHLHISDANAANSYHSHPNSHNSYRIRGFSLVEVLLAISALGLLVTALVGGLIYGQQSTAIAGMRSRAILLADEGLEAVRNIRDENYSNLTHGTYGLAISGNQWALSGTSDTTDIFTRSVTIATVDANRKQVVSTVTWPQNLQRLGTVTLTTYFTRWQASAGGAEPSTCTAYCQSLPLGYTTGTCRQNEVQCTNNGETYESGGDTQCVTTFPGDPSRDTCCCAP